MANRDHEGIAALVKKAQGGDRKAFSQIARMVTNEMVALTYRMTGSRDTALDLAQESLVAAWVNLKSFRGESGFETWLYRIVYNKTLSFLAGSKPTVSLDQQPESVVDCGATTVSADRELEQRELARDVLSFMQQLPPQQRLVFDLRFYKERSFEEIAQITGKAVGTVKTHYREAVIKLREEAKEKGWRA
jgi:RNA polymerase sigma factor (sigma-70 family)